jgi:hypothetical protein
MTSAPQYVFTAGARVPAGADPNVVGAELDRLRAAAGGLTAQAVLAAASDNGSPLHDFFTWDDTEAARKQRLAEAGKLIRSVSVTFITTEQKTETIRAYQTVSKGGNTPGVYQPITEMVRTPVVREILVRNMIRDLHNLKHRYQTLSEYIRISSAIDRMIDELENGAGKTSVG